MATELSKRLGLELGVAVVSKVLLPWTTEAGCGAVAFDGTVLLDDALIARLRLRPEQLNECIDEARTKVERRVRAMSRDLPAELEDRSVLLLDDGLASGYTMRAAIAAVRACGASMVGVAVPTGHQETVGRVAEVADVVFCANVRVGWPFAVAAAYRAWRDVSEEEALGLLTRTAA